MLDIWHCPLTRSKGWHSPPQHFPYCQFSPLFLDLNSYNYNHYPSQGACFVWGVKRPLVDIVKITWYTLVITMCISSVLNKGIYYTPSTSIWKYAVRILCIYNSWFLIINLNLLIINFITSISFWRMETAVCCDWLYDFYVNWNCSTMIIIHLIEVNGILFWKEKKPRNYCNVKSLKMIFDAG